MSRQPPDAKRLKGRTEQERLAGVRESLDRKAKRRAEAEARARARSAG